MANIEQAIYARLDDQVSYDIAPGEADENSTMPYIVYRRTDGDHFHAMEVDIDDTFAQFEFECFATTYAGAKTVKTAVHAALSRYSGTVSGVVIQGIYYITERDGIVDENRYSVVLVYKVAFDE